MKRSLFMLLLVALTFSLMSISGCDTQTTKNPPTSASGVEKMDIKVETNVDGHTNEQLNVALRQEMDNRIGAIKHLYVLSPMSGQVLIYSTVKGKVTSSGKRLTPQTVVDGGNDGMRNAYGFDIVINGVKHRTTEVLGDDGTYGHSIEYLFWWDSKGIYHQQYVEGCIIHISDQPVGGIKSVVLNMESR